MSELDHIRQRIEQAELRLRTSHSARERESAALQESWAHIHERIVAQDAELTALRAQVAALQDAKAELLGMVDVLLHAVEEGLERMNDETVPRIAAMAGELLGAETAAARPRPVPGPAIERRSAAVPAPDADADPDALDMPDAPDDEDAIEARAVLDREALLALQDDEDAALPAPVGESMSHGIRDLIARIEGSFPAAPPPRAVDGIEEDDDNELSRDLREIEALRSELTGLRARMTSDGL